ncbi:hypothetical protein [Nocardioides daphniae]|uniref:TNase-like domain-containing protein n=1 Tax=Nocardioides daphniae TaxID=402297 RepID=A0ABQ1Q1B3_9ACTN|nr:hypothetical protein [Nocardioides daphniae]GGD08888.1 hypothetical protein GCM10007231_04720 [Nocardioides daphniae]
MGNRRKTLSAWCAVVALLVLAGCGASDPGAEGGDKAGEETVSQEAVTVADLTDAPSAEVEYPTIKVPEGADPVQVDWLVKQLIEVTERSLDVEKVSRGTEADAVRWITEPVQESADFDYPAAFEKELGTGYSFVLGNRFAADEQPTGPVHVLGTRWESRKREGYVMVRLFVEQAIPFDEGVAVVRRWFGMSSPMDAGTTGRPGVQAYIRTLGVDRCAYTEEGAARPGDAGEVSERLDALKEREEAGGLSAWASAEEPEGPSNDPADISEECDAQE